MDRRLLRYAITCWIIAALIIFGAYLVPLHFNFTGIEGFISGTFFCVLVLGVAIAVAILGFIFFLISTS